MTRKCEGKADNYPGLSVSAAVQTATGGCLLTPREEAKMHATVENATILTFEVSFSSECDRSSMYHFGEGVTTGQPHPHLWKMTKTAPFRWESGPRSTSADVGIAAIFGRPPSTDREISLRVTAQAAGLALVGPFQMVLQVDTDGR
jgi:hypothetical protein